MMNNIHQALREAREEYDLILFAKALNKGFQGTLLLLLLLLLLLMMMLSLFVAVVVCCCCWCCCCCCCCYRCLFTFLLSLALLNDWKNYVGSVGDIGMNVGPHRQVC